MSQASPSDASVSSTKLQIHLLGRFAVSIGGQTIPDGQWRLRKSRSLIKLLALAPQHRLHREQLLDTLWPDLSPDEAAHNLHQVLYIARRALDTGSGTAGHLSLQDDVLSLGPPVLWIDAEAFEAVAQQARQSRDPAAYRAALDLYSGDLLPEDRDEDWAAARRESLHQLRLELMLKLAAMYEDVRDFDAAIETTERALTGDPALEEAHRSLMRLYALSGRRQQALRQYQLLVEALRHEVDAEPDAESQRLYQQIMSASTEQSGPEWTVQDERQSQVNALPSSAPSKRATHNNLPHALDSFVGREAAIAEVKRLLSGSRLVTLTGSGGCGKTRLALAVAATFCGDAPAERLFPDGVWLVEFAALADGELVVQQVANALGLREQPGQPLLQTLSDSLRDKQMLLLFDNCEHLIAACAQLAESLLRSCAHLRILATSREPLRIAGEANYRVPSLSVPAISGQPSAVTSEKHRSVDGAQQLAEFEAVRLFVERATAVNTAFHLTEGNAHAVAQICTRLDGMPLAIELAAVRVTGLSPEQIAARLDDRFRLLTAGSRTAMARHQTLHAAIEWSYELLTEPERVLLRRLSVFSGGWTLEAAEGVCADGVGAGLAPALSGQAQPLPRADVLDVLTRLVDKSLVTMSDATSEIRFGMLETIHDFSREKLREAGNETHTYDLHLRFFLNLVEHRADMLKWLAQLDTERDNVRAALDWAVSHNLELGTRLAVILWDYWFDRNHREAIAQYRRILEHPGAKNTPMRGTAFNNAGFFSALEYDFAGARAFLAEARKIGDALGDKYVIGDSILNLGALAEQEGDYPTARHYYEENLALQQEAGDKEQIAVSLHRLGAVALHEREPDRALRLYERSLALLNELEALRPASQTNRVPMLYRRLGQAQLQRGDFTKAIEYCRLSLRLNQELRESNGILASIAALASIAQASGNMVQAAKLLAAVEALREASHATMQGYDLQEFRAHVAAVRASISTETLERQWTWGRTLTMEQAIAEAEEVALTPAAPAPIAPAANAGLTARELDVLRLLAHGLTDAQIAESLSVSTRTVNSHLRSIYSKLDVTTRTAAARYAAEFKLI